MTETTDTRPGSPDAQYWEDFYREREQVWSGRPNQLLVREVAALTPGTALDLGCGEGADAIWLAQQGWRVTAVDISATALERAAVRAAGLGVGERIDWQRHDLPDSFPTGTFDLVSAQFFHSPVALAGEREQALRAAARVVAPDGILLVAGHEGWPSWMQTPPAHHVHLPSTAEVLDALGLEPGRWRVELEDVIARDFPGPEGQPGTRTDNLLRVRRTG
ncbi:class I SAM-dependent methyltransferase [Plantactinospora sp. CA-290183]|uniref:class I SAM-dependent methyltransferase n=1 Tax=Plantactinospora sp. CA-290183 TaxID=3240006 RepID=UPI003D8CAAEF